MRKIYFTLVCKLKNCEILQTKGYQSQHYKNVFKVKVKHSKCVHYCSKYSTHSHKSHYSTTYHSRTSECLQNIGGTELVVFVLISFPQMSNILLLESVPLAEPQISNKIMCPYYQYVVL